MPVLLNRPEDCRTDVTGARSSGSAEAEEVVVEISEMLRREVPELAATRTGDEMNRAGRGIIASFLDSVRCGEPPRSIERSSQSIDLARVRGRCRRGFDGRAVGPARAGWRRGGLGARTWRARVGAAPPRWAHGTPRAVVLYCDVEVSPHPAVCSGRSTRPRDRRRRDRSTARDAEGLSGLQSQPTTRSRPIGPASNTVGARVQARGALPGPNEGREPAELRAALALAASLRSTVLR